jgi:hypothetical protein
MSALKNVIQMMRPLIAEDNDFIDPMYINRQFSARYGGKALTGSSFERSRQAEQIRRDFLEGCSDQELARQLAVLLAKTHIWIKVGRMGNARFEAKAAAVLAESDRLDELLALVKATPRTRPDDEIESISKEATVMLNRRIDLISGVF